MTTQITAALEALRDDDGLLRIETVVAAATDPASPLHSHFEWNDGDAAHRYRLGQARTLIRAQKISIRVGPAVIRSVTYVPAIDTKGAYRRLDEIEPSSDLAKTILLGELQRVGGALGRARNLAAVLHLESEVDELLNALSSLRATVASEPVS
jgi:hypothetical protein